MDLDWSYDDIFSDSNNFANSSFYKITPNIDITNTTTTDTFTPTNDTNTDSSFSKFSNDNITSNTTTNSISSSNSRNNYYDYDDNGYIDDTYSKNVLISGNNDDYDNDSSSSYSSKDKTIIKNIKLLDTYLQNINANINIYNDNIVLYSKTMTVLEYNFNFIITSLINCFNNNMKTLIKFRVNDLRKNIQSTYDPLIKYVKSIYHLYEHTIYTKIDEIQNYLSNIEKQLLKHSHALIQIIWYCCYPFPLTPMHDNYFKHYQNYKINDVCYKLKQKFQLLFKFIYLHISNFFSIESE